MKKLFKILSLLRLFRELRYTVGGRHHGHRVPAHLHRGDHWHARSRDYHPLYRRGYGRSKMKHLVRELLHGRRY